MWVYNKRSYIFGPKRTIANNGCERRKRLWLIARITSTCALYSDNNFLPTTLFTDTVPTILINE
eukprot:5367717-Amphidinium_carterae.1